MQNETERTVTQSSYTSLLSSLVCCHSNIKVCISSLFLSSKHNTTFVWVKLRCVLHSKAWFVVFEKDKVICLCFVWNTAINCTDTISAQSFSFRTEVQTSALEQKSQSAQDVLFSSRDGALVFLWRRAESLIWIPCIIFYLQEGNLNHRE